MPKQIIRIYTGSGDDGKTFIGGRRLSKNSPLVAAVGELDELNSFVGYAVIGLDKKGKEILFEVQNNLFIISGVLAGAGKKKNELSSLKDEVKKLEKAIDWYQDRLKPVSRFVLPGGCESAARLHLCRVVCRRAERAVVALNKNKKINPVIIKFLNRLSDFFYVLARWENKKAKIKEEFWN